MSATAAPEVTRFLQRAPAVRRARRRRRRRASRRRPRSSSTAPARRSSRRAPTRSSTCGSVRSGRGRDRASTAACSTCSARASCSVMPRCCPGCPPASRRGPREDTVCYRIPADVAQEPLSRPAGLRFVARSLLDLRDEGGAAVATEPGVDPPLQPVGVAAARATRWSCRRDTSIREAAADDDRGSRELASSSTSATGRSGSSPIATCARAWSRRGLGGDARCRRRCPRPRTHAAPDRLGGDVLLDMLDRGFRHFPVVSATGTILGVIEDDRPRRRRRRAPRSICAGGSPEPRPSTSSIDAARELAPDGGRDARRPCRGRERRRPLFGGRRCADAPRCSRWRSPKPATSASSSRGSRWAARRGARRCRAPTSTARSSGSARPSDEHVKPQLHAIGSTVVARLEACGLRADEHGATRLRSSASSARSIPGSAPSRSWIDDPTQEKALLLVSVLVDSRPVWGVHTGTPVADSVPARAE